MKKINTDLALDIYNYSITRLIDLINEVKEDSEVDWNSFGGSVYAGQKFADFMNNKEYKLNANVSAIAASMGAVLLAFFDNVKGSIQADVMLHSASGGPKITLKRTNEFLYAALAKKIDESVFKEITGFDLKTIMLAEDEDRVDVWFSGADAKKMGLFDESYDILVTGKAAKLNTEIDFTDIGYKVPDNIKNKYTKKANIINSNNNEMEIKDVTQSQLQSGNPSVFNAILEQGKKAEQSRVAGIMKYAKYDMGKANELLKNGDKITVEHVEYFMEKKFNNEKVAELEKGSLEEIKPSTPPKNEAEKTAEEKEKEAALIELRRGLGTDDLVENDKKK